MNDIEIKCTDYKGLLNYYETRFGINRNKVSLYEEICTELLKGNNYELLLYFSNKGLEIDNNVGTLYFFRFWGLFYQNKRKEAFDDLFLALNLDSRILETFIKAINTSNIKDIILEELKLLLVEIDSILEKNQKDCNALLVKGFIYSILNDNISAINVYSKLLNIDDENIDALFFRSNSFVKNKELNRALLDLEKLIKLEPKNVTNYYYSAIIYEQNGNHEKAYENFTKCLEHDDKNIDAYFHRGYLNICTKKILDEAISDFSKVIEIEPMYPRIYNVRAASYLLSGKKENKEKAFIDLKIALERDAKNNSDLGNYLYSYIYLLNENFFTIDFLVDCVCSNTNWEESVFTSEVIKKLYIYEHILMYFLMLKECDFVKQVATYTNISVLRKLIFNENGDYSNIRLSSLSNTNDTAEGTILDKIINSYTNKETFITFKNKRSAVQTSFTRCVDSLTMFRLYGKNESKEGTGVSLIFNKSFFDTSINDVTLPQCTISKEKDVLPLFYILYYDKKTKELIYNPYESLYKKIVIKLDDISGERLYTKYQYIDFYEKTTSEDEYFDSVKNNLGWLFKKIFDNFDLLSEEDIVTGYAALGNLRYLIKDSAYVEEQELRLLKILDVKNSQIDYERKIVYKDYLNVFQHKGLKKIILGSKINEVKSYAEFLRAYFAKENINGMAIDISISEAPFY